MLQPPIVDLIQPDRVHRRLYTDSELFRLEMSRIFKSTWIFIAHESEIAYPGDYKTTRIGLEPIIISRGSDDAIHALVNRCAHRGALVCREATGNSNYFRCPYHAWTYRNTGQLTGAPLRKRYPPDFDLDSLALTSLPRVESYRGLVFASFNPEVEPLPDYLGQVRPYIDAALNFSVEGEIDLSPGATRHSYPGNWKFQMENGVDGYHTAFVHETFMKMLQRADVPDLKFGSRDEADGWTEAFPRGHALLARRPDPRAIKSFKETYPRYADRLIEIHGEGGLTDVMTHMNIFIFPNLFLIAHHLRIVQPLDVAHTEVIMSPYLLKGAPRELNTRRMEEHEAFYPAAGFGSPDDFQVFATLQEALQAETVPWLILARGLHDERETDGGSFVGQATDEGHQRGMYREYSRLMSVEEVVSP